MYFLPEMDPTAVNALSPKAHVFVPKAVHQAQNDLMCMIPILMREPRNPNFLMNLNAHMIYMYSRLPLLDGFVKIGNIRRCYAEITQLPYCVNDFGMYVRVIRNLQHLFVQMSKEIMAL